MSTFFLPFLPPQHFGHCHAPHAAYLEQKIKDLPRNLNNVVLIDWDLENVKGQEDNVIIVPKMKAEDEEGDESEDRTLKVLGKFFQSRQPHVDSLPSLNSWCHVVPVSSIFG